MNIALVMLVGFVLLTQLLESVDILVASQTFGLAS